MEKQSKQLETTLSEFSERLDQSQRETSELKTQKDLVQAELLELTGRLEESERRIRELSKANQTLSTRLAESDSALEWESGLRSKIQSDLKATAAEVTILKDRLEDSERQREDAERLLVKAQEELTSSQKKLEARMSGLTSQEVEDVKRKLNAQIQDTLAQLEAALTKAGSAEKAKCRLQTEMEDIIAEAEKVEIVLYSNVNSPPDSCFISLIVIILQYA